MDSVAEEPAGPAEEPSRSPLAQPAGSPSLVGRAKELFPETGNPLTCGATTALVLLTQLPVIVVFVLFSAISPVAYSIYYWCVGRILIGKGFLAGAAALAFVAYICGWTSWRAVWLQALVGVVVAYVFAFGGLCYTRYYPSVPLILAYIQFVLYLTGIRLATAGKLSARGFYSAISLALWLAALWTLAAWLAWVFGSNMQYNAATKTVLHGKMQNIFDLYGINSSWDQCVQQRSLAHDYNRTIAQSADAAVLKSCSHLELITLLVWAAPFIVSAVCLMCGVVTLLRAYISTASGTVSPAQLVDKRLKVIMGILAVGATALWIGFQQMGSSMGLSNFYLAALLVTSIISIIWITISFDLHPVVGAVQESVLWKICQPILSSDWFFGLLLAITLIPLLFLLALDVLAACVQRLLGFKKTGVPGKSDWTTDVGYVIFKFVHRKHWTSCFEKAFIWSSLYFLVHVFEKFTSVFLGWLDGELELLGSLAGVCVIWYFVCLFLFMLPPVPGVPVYMSAGAIVAKEAKPQMGLVGGIIFASFLTTLLKNNAVFIHQTVIGRLFGKSQKVQQLVGVHTEEIRAIEKILRKPWTSLQVALDKIFILCGGPDWPVSVLTGILRLGVLGVAAGTAPSFFIIVPCVIAGACLVDESLKSMSSVIIVMVTVSQGGLLLAACISIAREAERSHEELSKPRDEHAELVKISKAAQVRHAQHLKRTAWHNAHILQKLLLVCSVLLQIAASGFITIRGVDCFRPFEIGNNISDSFAEGGLEGRVYNVVKSPEGVAAFILYAFAIVVFMVYRAMWGCSGQEDTGPNDDAGQTTPEDFGIDVSDSHDLIVAGKHKAKE